MSFDSGPEYHKEAPITPEQKGVLQEHSHHKSLEAAFGREGARQVSDVAEDNGISKEWISEQSRTNPEFQEEIRDNLAKIEASSLSEDEKDGIILQVLRQYENKSKNGVKQKLVQEARGQEIQSEVKAQGAEVKAQGAEVKANMERQQQTKEEEMVHMVEKFKNINTTKQNTEAFYKLIPGWREKLDKYLGEGSLDTWTEQAKKERPDLKPEELEGYALKAHKEDILRALPRSEFSPDKIRALEASLEAIQIPGLAPSASDALKDSKLSVRHREAIEYGIVAPNGEKNPNVTVDASNHRIRLSEWNDTYQTYEYNELPPTKYIEKKGLRIASHTEYEPRYGVEAREQELIGERKTLEADIGKNGDRMERVREQTIPKLQNELKNLDKGVFTPDTVDILVEAHNCILPGVGPELVENLAKSPANAADRACLQEHIHGLIQSAEAFETKQNRRREVLTELQDVELEKKNRVEKYQKDVKSSDRVARDNLSTLVSYGFHQFGQGGLESILTKVNSDPWLVQSLGITRSIELEQSFSDHENTDRRVLAEIISRLSGIPKGELFEQDGFTRKSFDASGVQIDDAYLRDAFARTGVVEMGVVNSVKIDKALREGVKEGNTK